MAKITVDVSKESTLVRFDSLRNGEVFVSLGAPHIKVNMGKFNSFGLISGIFEAFVDDDLVTYVKKAELKLTI
jgi:hypothetical protein